MDKIKKTDIGIYRAAKDAWIRYYGAVHDEEVPLMTPVFQSGFQYGYEFAKKESEKQNEPTR